MPNIPLLKTKFKGKPISSASELLLYKKRIGQIPNIKIPKTVILGFQDSLENYVKELYKIKGIGLFRSNFYIIHSGVKSFAFVTKFGTGAPATSVITEELIAMGAKKFIIVATAGSMQSHIRIGDLVICTQAFSDDGVSRHYLENVKVTFPTTKILSFLTSIFSKRRKNIFAGPSWTVDAPFMETDNELRYFQNRGVVTVEMEASALFAIAKVRKVSAGAVFVISDTLGTKWKPHFNSAILEQNLNKTFDDIVAGMKNCDIF